MFFGHSVYPAVWQNDNHGGQWRAGRQLSSPGAGRQGRAFGVIRALTTTGHGRRCPSHGKRPRPRAVADQNSCFRRRWGNQGPPGIISAGWRNEGVGEHVRTRFHVGLWSPVKLRIIGSAPNEENLFLLPDRFSKERTL